jgi:hypothetical protein
MVKRGIMRLKDDGDDDDEIILEGRRASAREPVLLPPSYAVGQHLRREARREIPKLADA